MIFKLVLSITSLFFFFSCEDKDNSVSDNEGLVNTLSQSNLGLSQVHISDYFYDFNSSVNVSFLNYRQDGLINTILYPGQIDINSDTINFKTFPNFLLKVNEFDATMAQNIEVFPFDETQGGNCIDIGGSCPDINNDSQLTDVSQVLGVSQVDTLVIYSHQFTSIDKLAWSQEDNRYKTILKDDFAHEDPDDPDNPESTTYSQWEYGMQTVPLPPIYEYDSLIYTTKIDTNITTPEGIFYIDESEFIKRDSTYSSTQIPIEAHFQFDNMNSLSSDSIMFHLITDCDYDGERDLAEEKLYDLNGNGDSTDVFIEWVDGYLGQYPEDGIYQVGENCVDMDGDGIASCTVIYEFVDRKDNILTDEESYWDINGDGVRQQNEPFEDRNCNGELDNSARRMGVSFSGYTSEGNHTESDCAVKGGTWNSDDSYCDLGNFQWDGDEIYIDVDGDGVFSNGDKLTQLMGSPSRFVFDYSDQANPVALSEIDATIGSIELKATSLSVSGEGNVIDPPLQTNVINDVVTQYVPEIDSIVTIFSNEIIAQINQDLDNDYHITKLKTAYTHPTLGLIEEHSYNIFNDDSHVTLLNYPNYFVPYGFYWTPQQIDDGFWNESFLTEEVMLYTYNGIIREGEHIQLDTLMVTSHGNYNIEVDYVVELDNDVSVPAFDEVQPTGDIYKITKTLIMTFIGSGVEYGERVTSWLAKDSQGPLGIIKDKVEIRWTEPAWVCPFVDNSPNPDCYDWTDFSRWELLDIRRDSSSPEGSFGFLSKLLNTHRVELKDLENIEEFEGHPFESKRTAGMHPVRLIDNR